MIKVALQSVTNCADDPGAVLRGLNHILAAQTVQSIRLCRLCVVRYGKSDSPGSAAGHPPLLRWKDATLERIESNGFLFGMFQQSDYPVFTMSIDRGERFILYTDGVSEAENGSGGYFGDTRFEEVVRDGQRKTAAELSEKMLSEIGRWRSPSTPQQDDITLVIIDVVDTAADTREELYACDTLPTPFPMSSLVAIRVLLVLVLTIVLTMVSAAVPLPQQTALVETGSRWYKGNTHTHTLNSDGDSTPDDVVRWYREHGYQFLVLTDHNFLTSVAGLNALHGADEKFLVIKGEEVTDRYEDESLHINGLDVNAVCRRRAARRSSTCCSATWTRFAGRMGSLTSIILRSAGPLPRRSCSGSVTTGYSRSSTVTRR